MINGFETSALDLDGYLNRIGYEGSRTASTSTLEALHAAHATRVPFENLDILLGRPIRLDLPGLQDKLVRHRRGGYCFEQNLLFGAALQALGFAVTPLAARVSATRVLPRTHMLLLVDVEGHRWIADVGFGLAGLLRPLPCAAGTPVQQSRWTYCLAEHHGRWMLQWQQEQLWRELYQFSLEPQEFADYEMANHYTSTHPHSRFVQTLTVQRITEECRFMLINRTLTIDDGARVTSRVIPDDEGLLDVLATTFDLRFPAGTRFGIVGG